MAMRIFHRIEKPQHDGPVACVERGDEPTVTKVEERHVGRNLPPLPATVQMETDIFKVPVHLANRSNSRDRQEHSSD